MPLRKDPSEVISDSEPERLRQAAEDKNATTRAKGPHNIGVEVIEISSDEGEDVFMPVKRTNARAQISRPRNCRKIIESSDEEEEDSEEIEFVNSVLTPSASNPASKKKAIPKAVAALRETEAGPATTPSARGKSKAAASPSSVDPTTTLEMYTHSTVYASPANPVRASFDESIFILDEPRSARKPKAVGEGSTTKKGKATKQVSVAPSVVIEATISTTTNVAIATPKRATKKSGAVATPSGPSSASASVAPKSNRKPTKKQLEEADMKRRHEFAQQLFADLNAVVFGGLLPEDTALVWNKRLLTTAGRAKWHRSRDGVQSTEIELADKILDCEERIKMTLSHEMCHLATWVIDKEIKEHHGEHFKRWAARVERKRPDIEVSVKHNYEISYPYEWKCQKCGKVYGRHSKSINPDAVVCGACREGRLEPQFKVKSKPANTTSRMAASKPQDSPLSTPVRNSQPQGVAVQVVEDFGDDSLYEDDDSEIEVLAMTLKQASLQDIS